MERVCLQRIQACVAPAELGEASCLTEGQTRVVAVVPTVVVVLVVVAVAEVAAAALVGSGGAVAVVVAGPA